MSARTALSSVLLLALGTAALADDPPDSTINARSGSIEVVDTTWTGADWNIRHVINPGGGQPARVLQLTTDSGNDLGARITAATSGDIWVTWWRDAPLDQVLFRKRSWISGAWSSETAIGLSTENNSRPEIVHDGLNPWVAYRIAASSGTGIAVCTIRDAPEPIPQRVYLRTAPFNGDVDLRIHCEMGRLWVTWVDDGSSVGWSRYDYTSSSWGTPAFESYVADSVVDARARIRSRVLGS